ncbi:MAG: outer membrane beta-barrel protein, partial [Bdellovibrionales bacterium]|nr:outer membrane beta-barrel protein [Bdellovibrionales bacterium]
MKSLIFAISLLLTATAYGQYQGDDVYDPFADYSEFEENSQEEADVHFFRNGRFFNAALMMGGRMFTADTQDYFEANMSPGLYLAYFFNLRFAVQFSYTFSEHAYQIPAGTNNSGAPYPGINGNVSFSAMAFDLKYYFNTQNVTRGLADLNPFILFGFSQNYRTFSVDDQTQVAKDDAAGFDFGAGIEIPIARNQMYVGAQFVYTYVNFPIENRNVTAPDQTLTDKF